MQLILGLIFILYLGVFLLLKSINEISNNSIEYFANLNELLALVVLSGISYYLLLGFNKKNRDILEEIKQKFDDEHPTIIKVLNIILSIIGGFLISYIVYQKTQLWNGGSFVAFASFILTAVALLVSLTSSKQEK